MTDPAADCVRDDHDRVLERVVVGDLDESSPEARALLSSCAGCRARLAKLRATAAALEEEGEVERAILVEARETRDAAGAKSAASVLRGLATPPAPRRPAAAPPRRAFVALAAAAVLVVAAGLLWNALARRGSGVDDPTLGGALVLDAPNGAVTEYGTFRWRYTLPPDGRFEVVVFDDSGAGTAEIAKSGRLTQPEWTPPEEARARFGRAIRWQVSAFDVEGGLRAREETRASRSP